MCGRYSFVAAEEKITEQFGVLNLGKGLRSSYNIAPTQQAHVITNDAPDQLQNLIWGLIPHWSNNGQNSGRLINARAEGIASKPSFRLPIRQRRCLVLADSFYEWRRMGKEKIPHRILLKNGELLAFAGIWDSWKFNNNTIKSFSIITTSANADMILLHSRMPVILNTKEAQEAWLSSAPLEGVLSMLQPAKNDILIDYVVSQKVNSVQNNEPELHYRVQVPPSLF